jgi:GGDEF domain-containing protein
VIEPRSGQDEWAVQERLSDWLHRDTRNTDLIGYLGNGCFVALLTETGLEDSDTLLARLRSSIPTIELGVASYPADGATYADLLRHAQEALVAGARYASVPEEAVG